MIMMTTTPTTSHFSPSNVDITPQLYSLFLRYNIFDDTINANDLFTDINATLESLNGYTS
jgi:hypothetical protein